MQLVTRGGKLAGGRVYAVALTLLWPFKMGRKPAGRGLGWI